MLTFRGFMSLVSNEKLSASLEDYLEVIYNLSTDSNVARSKDIAEALHVSRASVTGALKALSDKGLVHYKPYTYTTLTEQGRSVANRIVRRHAMLAQFFESVLGADPATAEAAACKAEHTLGPEITARLMAFIEFVSQTQDNGDNITQQFQHFWQHYNED
jgi:DtxR family Mn-dependent transcriptional regulator